MGGLQSKFTQMMHSKSAESESLDSHKKQEADADVVELENKLIMMEGEKLQAKE